MACKPRGLDRYGRTVARCSVGGEDLSAEAENRAEQLQTALNTRIVIEQAKGVIAERRGLDMDQSFEVLRRAARDHNRRLSELARAVVDGLATL